MLADAVCKAKLLNDFGFFVRYFFQAQYNKRFMVAGHHLQITQALTRVVAGDCRRLIINIPPRSGKTEIAVKMFVAWCLANSPSAKFIHLSYSDDLAMDNSSAIRDVVKSPEFQRFFPLSIRADSDSKKKWFSDQGGGLYATAAGGAITGFGAGGMGRKRTGTGSPADGFQGAIILDDAIKPDDAFSDTMRDRINRRFNNTIASRTNSPETPIIVIMQRLHENDMTGYLLAGGSGEKWEHLLIPAITEDGESIWPEKWSIEDLRRMEDADPYTFCTPGESPVLMRDLSLKPIRDVAVGDKIIGIDVNTEAMWEGGYSRRRLVDSSVVAISKSIRPVVKVTLDTGEVLRCTPNHKWYTAKRGGRPLYKPASIGSTLMRVCPSRMQSVTGDDVRKAGWLGGFFDGEGSVTLSHGNGKDAPPHVLITFAQGTGRNMPLCERLEEYLTYFGFEFGYHEGIRSDRVHKSDHKQRWYYLKGVTLPLVQRFLHVVEPVKWKDRLIDNCLGSRFIQSRERVVSIEPDGEELVYGLTTTTGNYVVWGIASSNSGQYMQTPSPLTGGILKPDNIVIVDALPVGQPIEWVRGWDFASTTTGDWTAGAKLGRLQDGRIIIADMVRVRVGPDERDAALLNATKRDGSNCRVSIPQDPGQAGLTQVKYLVRMLAGYSVKATPESGNKVVRAEPFASQVNIGNVMMLKADWNAALISEMRMFPNGTFDDQVDGCSRAFSLLIGTEPVQIFWTDPPKGLTAIQQAASSSMARFAPAVVEALGTAPLAGEVCGRCTAYADGLCQERGFSVMPTDVGCGDFAAAG